MLAEKLNKASFENMAIESTFNQTQRSRRNTISATGAPERLETFAWRNSALNPMLFHVELNALSILIFYWFNKSVVSDGKAKLFVAKFI